MGVPRGENGVHRMYEGTCSQHTNELLRTNSKDEYAEQDYRPTMAVAIVNIIILNDQGDIDPTVGYPRSNLHDGRSGQLFRRLRSRGTEREKHGGWQCS